MHSSQRSFAFVEGNVALRHSRLQAVRFELLLAKCPRKKTALVRLPFQVDDECAGQLSLRENQVPPAARPGRLRNSSPASVRIPQPASAGPNSSGLMPAIPG